MIPDGIHRDVPHIAYHERKVGVVSKSALDRIHRSPAHYRQWIDEPDESTPAMLFGSAFHCAALEPERYARDYPVKPDVDGRTREGKAALAAFREQLHERARGISAADAEAIDHMVAAVRSHRLVSRMLSDGAAEVTISWSDKATGLRCKSRADYWIERHRTVIDLKTTDDASPREFERSIAKYRYHVQDALYRFGFDAVDEPLEHFILVAVEKTAPWAVGVYELDAETIGRGYFAARQDMDVMAECLKTDTWPGYPANILQLSLPPWAA